MSVKEQQEDSTSTTTEGKRQEFRGTVYQVAVLNRLLPLGLRFALPESLKPVAAQKREREWNTNLQESSSSGVRMSGSHTHMHMVGRKEEGSNKVYKVYIT